jgi:CBS-domain-containing membrane protein
VADAWEALAGRGFGQAPVLDAQGLLVGLLLRADMLPPVLLPAPSATGISAWRLAQQSVPTSCSRRCRRWPPTPRCRAARVLLDMGLPGLPVTQDDGQVIGFLSRADILRAWWPTRRWTCGPEFSRRTTEEPTRRPAARRRVAALGGRE